MRKILTSVEILENKSTLRFSYDDKALNRLTKLRLMARVLIVFLLQRTMHAMQILLFSQPLKTTQNIDL